MSNSGLPPQKKGFRERFLSPIRAHIHPTSLSPRTPAPHSLPLATAPATAPTAPALASSPLPSTATTPSYPASSRLERRLKTDRLLQNALQPLSEQHRTLIQKYIPSTPTDVAVALDEAIRVARTQQQQYQDKRWTFTISGRTVTLQEEADKVARWLVRFRTVGDIVANVDPVHVGLPWAGVRLLLEVAITNVDTRASLLVGCESALYTSNRLKVYTEFYLNLPQTQARENLEAALIKLYTCILNFLAQAIQTYQSSSTRRLGQAFWRDSEIGDFETQCEKLAARVELEASNCDRTLYQSFTQQALDEIRKLYTLQQSLDRIETHIALDKLNRLPYAAGAEFDAYQTDHETCHPGTRLDVLHQIMDWAQQSDGKRIFWLNGMAGTGKSTISRTIARWSSDPAQRRKGVALGASFFFKRGEGHRGTAMRFFPTIVRQLATKVPALAPLVAKAIDMQPDVHSPLFGEQFEKLFIDQLKALPTDSRHFPILVVVVDALDECENHDHVRVIFQQCSRLFEVKTIKLKLLLSSRPELPIRLGFKKMSGDTHQDMVLHDVPWTVIQHDISIFLEYSFTRIREDHNDSLDMGTGLEDSWPGDATIEALTTIAVPLFIAAATICRFVSDPSEAPQRQLQRFLELQVGGLSQMEKTYLPVLQQLPMTRSDPSQRDRLYKQFRQIVGAIITVKESLSVTSLASLLQIPLDIVESNLRPLHSVLRIPSDSQRPIYILHRSFAEFMLSSSLSSYDLAIESTTTHRMLLSKCLEILSGGSGLRQDICGLVLPGRLRKTLDPRMIQKHLPLEVQYACQHWIYHVLQSDDTVIDGDEVHTFLRNHFLHWLEAMSLMGTLSTAIGALGDLQSTTPGHSKVSDLLNDALRFTLSNRDVADLAPLQLYSSATVFSPRGSLVRNVCGQVPAWIQRPPGVPSRWGAELQKLEGRTRWVHMVSFSPDGKLIAAASFDRAIRLWDASTGQEVRKLEGHADSVSTIAFSPKIDNLLVSASDDETVRLWDTSIGQELRKLEGYTSGVHAVAFSPDGKLIVSASRDNMLRLWNVNTGQETQKLEGHTHSVTAVAFSPDNGRLLASASCDKTVRLWDISTGREVQKLEGHLDAVTKTIISPDGKLLASASVDGTVRLWSVTKGQTVQEEQKLEAQASWFNAVAFSPDSKLLALARDDETVIRLIDVDTRQEVRKLEGHTERVSAAAFAPDGRTLVSASEDKTIRLWDTSKELTIQQPTCFTEYILLPGDSQTLMLDRDVTDLDRALVSSATNDLPSQSPITVKGDWIQWDGRDLLWLPHEYSTSMTAVHGNVVVFGHPSGRVDFIQLDYADGPT